MKNWRRSIKRTRSDEGFSLIELLVVVGIIIVLAALALPNIGGYIRNYRIRGAVQQVASEIQSARIKAIGKNVNLGVVFAVVANNQYQYGVEDDVNPQGAPPHPWGVVAWEGGGSWQALLADPAQAGPVRTLPVGIVFDNPANCLGGQAATDWGVRFSRLGAACDFTNPPSANFVGCPLPAPPPPVPATLYVAFVPGAPANPGALSSSPTAMVCLWEQASNLRKAVSVTPGGRVQAQP